MRSNKISVFISIVIVVAMAAMFGIGFWLFLQSRESDTTPQETPSESIVEDEQEEPEPAVDETETADPTATPSSDPSPAGNSRPRGEQSQDIAEYQTMLDSLQVRYQKGAPDGKPYSREDQFGPAWSYDFEGNGCDMRNNVLYRDLSEVQLDDGDDCVVLSGTVVDPYTDNTIDFLRGGGSGDGGLQIDHIVPLCDAWASGAYDWTYDQRWKFANDPDNLLAVSSSANTSKGCRTIEEWVPSNDMYWCQYAKDIISVKSKYGLSVYAGDKSLNEDDDAWWGEADELQWMLDNACAPDWDGYMG